VLPIAGNASREIVDDRAHATAAGGTDHRDEVVSAPVAEIGECVVTRRGSPRERRRSSLGVAAVCGLDPAVPARDREAGALEELGEAEAGLAFLVAELRRSMDRKRKARTSASRR
jgi:hypothetical protein